MCAVSDKEKKMRDTREGRDYLYANDEPGSVL